MEYSNDGYVMQVQNFSLNDGEGIRTIIFLCGCPLHCIWCCNPENVYYFDDAHYVTLDEIKKQIVRQALFFRRCNGGITFSGGEATVQQGFLRAMTECFYDMGYNLSIETCGMFDFDSVKDILEKMDLIFYDLKHMDTDMHKLFTGANNHSILENLKRVGTLNVPVVVRIPVIVGINAYEENIEDTCKFMRRYIPHAKLEFLPYHRLGNDKYDILNLQSPDVLYEKCKHLYSSFGFTNRMEVPSEVFLQQMKKIAEAFKIVTISYK